MINPQKTIDYWFSSSERDWRVVQNLFKSKYYDYALFFCHLVLEKILKAIVVKTTNDNAPYTHNLVALANRGNIGLTPDLIKILNIINTFNVAGRYSDVKLAFHKRCTKEYVAEYINTTKELFLWLKKEFQKK